MKKLTRALFVGLLLAFAIPAFSVEVGAVLSSRTDFKFDGEDSDTKSLDQRETLTPSLKTEIAKNSSFSIEGSVQHKWNSDFGYYNDNSLILDLNLLKFDKAFALSGAKSVYLALGRMNFVDSTGLVFAQNSDGLFLKFSSMRFEMAAYGGYTGLLNIKNNSILTSKGYQFVLDDEKKVYDFAAPYVVADVNLSAPYLFLNQTLSFEGIGVFAAGGPNELPDGEDNRLYGTIMLNGALASPLFYTASATLQTTDFSKTALLAKLDLTYFDTEAATSIGFSGAYASGDNGSLSPFTGFTKMTACYSTEEPVYSGILKTGIVATIKPAEIVFVRASLNVFVRAIEEFKYYGIQAAAGVRFQIFSDLQLSIDGNIFSGEDANNNRSEIAIGLAIAF